ncbi:MAG: transposase [Candidatus Sabulitectum sp.]|nr:transposase [Candidatus Sabulitectum sp.]
MYRLHYHFVFIPKYRRPVLRNEVGNRLRELIREICRSNDIEIIRGMQVQKGNPGRWRLHGSCYSGDAAQRVEPSRDVRNRNNVMNQCTRHNYLTQCGDMILPCC